jgi:sterol 3beta-glucosyltransferase
VVHHGGAGTTAAGLRAGRPSVVCPFFGDQPYWGRRVHALGAGPEPILQKRLTAETLAGAIHEAVSSASIRQRAAALGETLRAEDGVGTAVRFIEAAAAR